MGGQPFRHYGVIPIGGDKVITARKDIEYGINEEKNFITHEYL